MAKTVLKESRCCIFQSIKKFACEFGIKEDAERKSPSNGMSALCEPKILERLWLCVLVWLCLHLGSQKAIWSLRGRGSNPVGRIVGDIKGGPLCIGGFLARPTGPHGCDRSSKKMQSEALQNVEERFLGICYDKCKSYK